MRTTIDFNGLTGTVVTREEVNYEISRTMWNRAIEKYPLAIVYCQTIEDVKNSIKWARKKEVPIRIRSGGHHYEGYSTGNEVLVIDVSQMNQITVDEANHQVTVEGGARNRALYEALGARGYAFPGGGCPTVGVAGFALGGGWGYSARYLGLGCDAIEQITLVNYEGNLLVASAKEHSDLFWALKGSGGGQFGVIVSLTFKLPEKISEATLVRLEYSEVTRMEQIKMWQLWQESIQALPNEVNFKLSFYNSKEKGAGILLIGIYYGSQEEAWEVLTPFVKLGRKLQTLVQPMTVLEVNRWIQDAHPDYEHYKSSGRFVEEKLSEAQMEELLEGIQQRAEGSTYTALSCYGMGGKILEPNVQSAAFYYRNSLYILGFQSVWEDNAYAPSNKDWFEERFEIIKSYTAGSFVNFPAQKLEDYRTAYYGAYKERLVAIRKQYDPEQVFGFEQGL